jgi:hypothetical protein
VESQGVDLVQAGVVLGSVVVGGVLATAGNYFLQRRQEQMEFRGYARLFQSQLRLTSKLLEQWAAGNEWMVFSGRGAKLADYWTEHELLFARYMRRLDLAQLSNAVSSLALVSTAVELSKDDELKGRLAAQASNQLNRAAALLERHT